MNRKHFLKSLIGSTAFLTVPFDSYSFDKDSGTNPLKETARVVKENIPTGEKIVSDALGNAVFTKQAQLNFNKY